MVFYRITQNHRMFGVGRDLCGSSSPLEVWSLLGQMHCVQGAQVRTSGLQFLTALGCWLLWRDEGALRAQNICSGDADTTDNTACISAHQKAVSTKSLVSFCISVKLVGKSFASTPYIIDILL